MSEAILACQIGSKTSIEGWPSCDLSGLFDALSRWQLDTRMDLSGQLPYRERPGSAPFRGRAWGHCVMQFDESLQKRVAVATKPIYPDHPEAVRYCGNFIGYSFGFWLDTADKELIAKLDEAIAKNIAHNWG